MLSIKYERTQPQSSEASQMLLEESFVDLKRENEIAASKLEYLLQIRQQSKQQLVELKREVKDLRKKLKMCERKVDRSIRKNEYIENSLAKMKGKVEKNSIDNGFRRKKSEGDERLMDLGKFVRKSWKSRKTDEYRFPSQYVSADHTKPSQTTTISKSPVTPRIPSKNSQPYFDEPTSKAVKGKKGEKKKNNYHQYIQTLKKHLDGLIYKQLKSENKHEKKSIRKQIKEASQQLEQIQVQKNRTIKCKCKHGRKIPSEFMKY